MNNTARARDPYLWEALISIFGLVVAISYAIVKHGADPHIPMLFGVLVAALIGYRAGFSIKEIEKGMIKGVANSIQAIIILSIIGILIGVWIFAGVVPTIIYYGLKILHPKIFLPATVVICAITSLATGTSWGTSGTIGIALIGIGKGLGFPLPIVAGAVLSGAYFGDKMSPLSDTTNLASAMAGADLYDHIKHMSYTTSVSIGLTLIIEAVIGLFYGGGAANAETVNLILTTIDKNFTVSAFLLIPPLVIMFLAYKKVPAIPGITAGILAAAILGMFFQGESLFKPGDQTLLNVLSAKIGTIMGIAYGGFSSKTGVEVVDTLLSKGGFSSMYYTIGIILCAMMYGGILEHTNQLKVIVLTALKKAHSSGSLITASVLTGIASNLVLCDQYMSVVLGARMYAQPFKEKGLHPKNLSRAVEDSATVTANLIPWNSCGSYQASTLGVATWLYLPFAFFNWLSPLVTLAFGWFNITIERIDQKKHEEDDTITIEVEA